jgi:NADPH:quinone reductase-like Zn-dependent oxidoreductase
LRVDEERGGVERLGAETDVAPEAVGDGPLMRAYVYAQHGGPEREAFADVDRPVPGPGQLLVSVRAAGVNPADWKRRSGSGSDGGQLSLPVGLGREVAGVVAAVGEQVPDFKVGDEVLGQVADGLNGGFGQYALVAAHWTVRKPPEVSFIDAAALPIAAATAYDGVNQLALQPGDTLLVNGAGGGVGIAACQFARLRGIRTIGTASAGKRVLVESVGATHVLCGEGAPERARALAPRGVDGLFDLVGGGPLRELATLVTDRSKLVTAADAQTASELGGQRVVRERTARVLEEIVQLVKSGAFNPFVTEVFPFERAGDAMRLVESGHATGKVVLEMG